MKRGTLAPLVDRVHLELKTKRIVGESFIGNFVTPVDGAGAVPQGDSQSIANLCLSPKRSPFGDCQHEGFSDTPGQAGVLEPHPQ